MNFERTMLIVGLIFLVFKGYIIRGVYQATGSPLWTGVYAVFTILTLVLGLITMVRSFSHGMIDMEASANFLIALMISTIICEFMISVFFVVDDVVAIVQYFADRSSVAERKGRRRFIKTIGLALGSLPFSAYLYGITKGKYDYKVFNETLTFSDLPAAFDGFKIVQFSDMHSGTFDNIAQVQRGFDMIQAQNPDLILFTGDLVNDLADEFLPYKQFMENLEAPFGKFSVLGNHDYPSDHGLFPTEQAALANLEAIKMHHKQSGFKLLNNANAKIKKGHDYIRVLGVENWGRGFLKAGDLDVALQGCENKEFSILMSHDPTHWSEKVLKHPKHIHLTLSGHTHGMQMGLEALGIKWSPIKYVYNRWAGLYKEFGQYLYVNRGFGFLAFAGRVGIPPEITVITLKTKK